MLTVEAFNALLKTLEEPPEYCLFILATTELYKVPLTIRSRCQLLRFDRGSTAALEKALKIAAAGEGLEVDDTVYTLIAEHAEGGFRDALSLLESLSTRHTHLTRALAEEGLGILPELQARELLEACLTGDTAQLLPLLAQQKGQLPGSLDAILSQLIRQVQERLYHSKIKNTEHLAYALQQFLEAYILLRSTPVASLPLELACLSICQYVAPPGHTDIHRPSQLNKSPEVHGIALDVTVSPTPPKEREPVVELRQDAVKDPRQAWKLMIEQICRENLVLGQTLKQTVFHKAEGQTITIHVRYQFHADKLNEKRNRNYVLQLLHDLTGRDWSVEYEVSTSVPKPKVRKEITVGEADAVAVFGN
ncbi:hypothetical protein KGQ71_01375 [Patescibacteria group bacterium]|nr:hypothetical protein [Patescibacteria group bacterium]